MVVRSNLKGGTVQSTQRAITPASQIRNSCCSINLRTNPIDPKRIFCLLPWRGRRPTRALNLLAEEKVEEEFFRQFAQIGQMEYCHAIRDSRGRLSHGFSLALRECNSVYQSRPAQGQHRITTKLTRKMHLPCGYSMDVKPRNVKGPCSMLSHIRIY